MGRVRGPNPEKKLRNLKDYSIPSKRATFYGGVTPLPTSSEPPNIDQKWSFFSEIDLDLQKSDVEFSQEKFAQKLQYFLFSKCPRNLKSDHGARRYECRRVHAHGGGVPTSLHQSNTELREAAQMLPAYVEDFWIMHFWYFCYTENVCTTSRKSRVVSGTSLFAKNSKKTFRHTGQPPHKCCWWLCAKIYNPKK